MFRQPELDGTPESKSAGSKRKRTKSSPARTTTRKTKPQHKANKYREQSYCTLSDQRL